MPYTDTYSLAMVEQGSSSLVSGLARTVVPNLSYDLSLAACEDSAPILEKKLIKGRAHRAAERKLSLGYTIAAMKFF